MRSWTARTALRNALLTGPLILIAGCGGSSAPSAPNPLPTAGSCAAGAVVPGTPAIRATQIASGFSLPLDLQSVAGDRSRLFVVEQRGRIRILRNGSIVTTPFLDISARVSSTGGERGLLGLAFHPQFATNGRFFVNYTGRADGHTRVSEFRVSSTSPDLADATTEREILLVNQPFENHNGGGLAFGPDGFLYIGLGDGGSSGDPLGNAQNPGVLLGKMLRIDVNGTAPYSVPANNPFVGQNGFRPEIWAVGLRNPWRFSFNRGTGDLYIGDVGQSALEEINVGLASRQGGENYGWNTMEGSRCFRPSTGCATAGLTAPVAEYGRSDGYSVTGGVVYRGCRMPGYAGHYFYADYGTALLRSFRLEGGRAVETRDWSSIGTRIDHPSSFGVDADGEIYLVDYDGEVYRLEPSG